MLGNRGKMLRMHYMGQTLFNRNIPLEMYFNPIQRVNPLWIVLRVFCTLTRPSLRSMVPIDPNTIGGPNDNLPHVTGKTQSNLSEDTLGKVDTASYQVVLYLLDRRRNVVGLPDFCFDPRTLSSFVSDNACRARNSSTNC